VALGVDSLKPGLRTINLRGLDFELIKDSYLIASIDIKNK